MLSTACDRAGTIAAWQRQWGRADYWFARAVKAAPSIPFAYADWGQSLLARGKPDAAIAKFTLANQKGPHFADPLEGWGEALMAKNQSHLALAKFAEAEKYAPNWGRLHLKWGEALVYAGKKDEAQGAVRPRRRSLISRLPKNPNWRGIRDRRGEPASTPPLVESPATAPSPPAQRNRKWKFTSPSRSITGANC